LQYTLKPVVPGGENPEKPHCARKWPKLRHVSHQRFPLLSGWIIVRQADYEEKPIRSAELPGIARADAVLLFTMDWSTQLPLTQHRRRIFPIKRNKRSKRSKKTLKMREAQKHTF
jgi:hypothetical protein